MLLEHSLTDHHSSTVNAILRRCVAPLGREWRSMKKKSLLSEDLSWQITHRS